MKSLKQLMKDEKGQVQNVRVTGVVAITLVIVVLVYFSVRNTIDQTDFTSDQNDTMDAIDDNVESGLELFGLVVIVAAASLILALLGGI